MKLFPTPAALLALAALALPACDRLHAPEASEAEHAEHQKIVVTRPAVQDVTITRQYVGQLHSRQRIKVCALEGGYLAEIPIKEGQAVKKGDPLFKIVPTLFQAKFDAEAAEARVAQLEFNNTKKLNQDKQVADTEVALAQAKLDKANAKMKLAQAELNLTNIVAPFDGLVDRLHEQLGSLIKEGEVLTTLSDNSVMWVYFNVPEAQYLEYMATRNVDSSDGRQIELLLANGAKFSQPGAIGAVEAEFNHETGNIPFRADFPNPDGLLRHGQTGKVLINQILPKATVIPQRATFEILDRRYVFVVDEHHKVHQREIVVEHELEDIFVLKSGLNPDEKFVLEGVRQVRDDQEVEAEFRKPEDVLANQKHPAE